MYRPSHCQRRRGTATVELAVLLPLLAFLFAVAVDYSRVLYYAVIVESAARNGALYGSRSSTYAADTNGIQQAALNDAADMTPAPNVSAVSGTDGSGNAQITVTATWTFQALLSYPGIPSTVNLSSSVTMRVLP